MDSLPDAVAGKMGLLIGPRAEREAMLKVAARLALRGPVRILDGGNSFDAFQVARHIRRQTPLLDQALDRIQVARAFTCYQVVTLFAQTPTGDTPHLVLDMLATFYDESVSLVESERLLGIVIGHLGRLSHFAPVLVSIRTPLMPERSGLVRLLCRAADQVYSETAPAVPTTPTLFS
jgi:hypothetical protein